MLHTAWWSITNLNPKRRFVRTSRMGRKIGGFWARITFGCSFPKSDSVLRARNAYRKGAANFFPKRTLRKTTRPPTIDPTSTRVGEKGAHATSQRRDLALMISRCCFKLLSTPSTTQKHHILFQLGHLPRQTGDLCLFCKLFVLRTD